MARDLNFGFGMGNLGAPHKKKEIDTIVISCLTLACKMRKTDFDTTKFLQEHGLTHRLEEVVRAELRVLRLLKLKIQQLTPICFVHCFSNIVSLPSLHKFGHILGIIARTQDDISFAHFHPSTMAASAIFCVLDSDNVLKNVVEQEFHPNQKETIHECTALMRRIYDMELSSQRSGTTEVEEMDQVSSEDTAGGFMHILFESALKFGCPCLQASQTSVSATMNEDDPSEDRARGC